MRNLAPVNGTIHHSSIYFQDVSPSMQVARKMRRVRTDEGANGPDPQVVSLPSDRSGSQGACRVEGARGDGACGGKQRGVGEAHCQGGNCLVLAVGVVERLQEDVRQHKSGDDLHCRTSECNVAVVQRLVRRVRVSSTSLPVKGVSIYRRISMYNGSDSNTSAHTRFAKPACERDVVFYLASLIGAATCNVQAEM